MQWSEAISQTLAPALAGGTTFVVTIGNTDITRSAFLETFPPAFVCLFGDHMY